MRPQAHNTPRTYIAKGHESAAAATQTQRTQDEATITRASEAIEQVSWL
jgi:hypothetical protein